MSNRKWLKELAATETQSWIKAVAAVGLAGVHRLETNHTIYVFRDGACVDVARRDFSDESNAHASAIGMRVVGWLLEVEGQRKLLDRWLPGARAVMWRPPSDTHESKIALTSPSFGFVACSQTDEDEDEVDDCATTAEYVPPPSFAGSSGSFTRLFPQ
jgi:hypothetical protein